MSWYSRLANVFRPERHAADLDDELQFHVDERVDALVAAGWRPEDARREALRRFGSRATHTERTRDMDIARGVEIVLRDLRHGWRQLRLNRGFATVAVVSLALGIGSTSGMFQLIDALEMRPIPVRDAAQLVTVTKGRDFVTAGWYVGRNTAFTWAQVETLGRLQHAFSGLLAFGTTRFNLSTGGESRYAEGLYVTPNFLQVLGVAPAIGAGFDAAADPRDCRDAGVLLNHTFWQREFEGDPGVLSRTLTLDGRVFPIVGVTPASFDGPEPGHRFDVAVPVCADTLFGLNRMDNRSAWWLTPIGRLDPGWTVARADRHLHDLSPRIFEATLPGSYRPDLQKAYLANVLDVESARSGVSNVRQDYEQPLWIMFAVAVVVLLIACANLANLMLARASAREREMVLRLAIGASRRRLVGQLMTESLLLAGLGAIAGALVARAIGAGLVVYIGGQAGSLHLPLTVDWRVVVFTAALGLGACVLFGLAPALRATRSAPTAALGQARSASARADGRGLRRSLVIAQIALSFVLLVGALLFAQSLRNLLATDTGLDPRGLLVANLHSEEEPALRVVQFRDLEARVRRLPGVASAARVLFTPFGGNGWNEEGYADGGTQSDRTEIWFNRVGPGYFAATGTPLLAGRDIETRDDLRAPEVAVINETFARTLFGEANPVGRSFRTVGSAGETDPVFRVIGVVADTKYREVREDQRAIAFRALAQDPEPDNDVTLVVRTRGDAAGVRAGIQREMAALDPGLLVEFGRLDVLIDRSILRDRLLAIVSAGFGLLAVTLSAVGLYGVMAYTVSRRRSEIGVRLALGARSSDILGLVFGETGRLLLVGLVLGAAGSLALSRVAESLLYGLASRDVTTMVMAGLLLSLTALGAALGPARRAAALDPAVTLRND